MSKNKKDSEPALDVPQPKLDSVSYGISVTKTTKNDRTETKTYLNKIKYNVYSGATSSVESVEVEDIAYGLAVIEIELLKELKVGQ